MEIRAALSNMCRRSVGMTLLMGFALLMLMLAVMLPVLSELIARAAGLGSDEAWGLMAGELSVVRSHPWLFRLLMALQQMGTWGLVTLLMAAILRDSSWMGLSIRPRKSALLLAILAMIAAIPLVQWLMFGSGDFRLPDFLGELEQWIKASELALQETLLEIMADRSPAALVGNLVVFALVPSVCEELFFRGFVQRQLQRRCSVHLAVVLTALVFSLVHFQFLGFFSRFVLGMMLGYFFAYGGSLWPSIAAHFSFNALSVGMAWQQSVEGMSREAMFETPEIPGLWALGSSLLTGLLMYAYIRSSYQRRPKPQS